MFLAAFLFATQITFVPLDDRPVTRQLPQMLGQIAGARIVEPPRKLLGNYLSFGQPDKIIAWLNGGEAKRGDAFVISNDMLVHGGLVASRVPGTMYADAYFRQREYIALRAAHPKSWIGAFGTIMRLAPTGVPAVGPGQNFFAAYPVWSYIQQYANLHDPPLPSEEAVASKLRAQIGDAILNAYLATRARNLAIDLNAIRLVKSGAIDNLVLGQDDAGPVGLHVKEVAALKSAVQDAHVQYRVAIEPGADELGMAMVAQALARSTGWIPRVAVRYSMPGGARYNDPLEYAPIETAIDGLIKLCGAVRDDNSPDIILYVRVPQTDPAHDDAFFAAIVQDEAAGKSVALADLTFLESSFRDQATFMERMLAAGAASKLDAYASWNTNANTVGTAVAEAIAAGAGRRTKNYDDLAHKEFTFNRIIDDYAFHDYVRPEINTTLDKAGVADHTWLLEEQAAPLQKLNRDVLFAEAAGILQRLYPGYHVSAIDITLPWNRTFETEIEARIAPNI